MILVVQEASDPHFLHSFCLVTNGIDRGPCGALLPTRTERLATADAKARRARFKDLARRASLPRPVSATNSAQRSQRTRAALDTLNVAGVQKIAALRYHTWYVRTAPSVGTSPFTEIGRSPASGYLT